MIIKVEKDGVGGKAALITEHQWLVKFEEPVVINDGYWENIARDTWVFKSVREMIKHDIKVLEPETGR